MNKTTIKIEILLKKCNYLYIFFIGKLFSIIQKTNQFIYLN